MAALRDGRPEPEETDDGIDEVNAILHANRADWTWGRVEVDADASADALMAEVAAASDEVMGDPRMIGSIMGNGSEHDLGHLGPIAADLGLEDRVLALADLTETLIDVGDWPERPAAFARYNLACFHALGGRLDAARALLRKVPPPPRRSCGRWPRGTTTSSHCAANCRSLAAR